MTMTMKLKKGGEPYVVGDHVARMDMGELMHTSEVSKVGARKVTLLDRSEWTKEGVRWQKARRGQGKSIKHATQAHLDEMECRRLLVDISEYLRVRGRGYSKLKLEEVLQLLQEKE